MNSQSSSPSSRDLSLKVIDASALNSIRAEWLALQSRRSCVVTQDLEYFEAFLAAFAEQAHDARLALIYAEQTLMGLVPFRARRILHYGVPVRVLQFPELPMPIRDVLLDAELSRDTVVDVLRSPQARTAGLAWDYLHLFDVPWSSPLLESGERWTGRGCAQRAKGESNAIDVSGQGYVQTRINSNARNNLKRNRKKLAEYGDFSCHTVCHTDDFEAAFQAFLDTEAAGWKSVSGGKRAVKLHADQTAFYRDLMYRKGSDCHIHLLLLNGQAIASDFCIISNGVCFSLKHGYDEDYKAAAPGNILREYTINYYENLPLINSLDLVSSWSWHSRWKPQARRVYDVKVFNRTLRGRLLYGLLLAKQILQKPD